MSADQAEQALKRSPAQRRQAEMKLWLMGMPLAAIARQVDVSDSQVRRDLAGMRDELRQAHISDLDHDRARSLATLRHIQFEAWQFFARLKDTSPNKAAALNAILAAEVQVGKVLGISQPDIRQLTTVNVLATGEWTAVRGAILHALGPYPDAARAVVDALAAPAVEPTEDSDVDATGELTGECEP